jgi:DNA-binding NarL/FixJ family response regulator/signal transduction histidine kinase
MLRAVQRWLVIALLVWGTATPGAPAEPAGTSPVPLGPWRLRVGDDPAWAAGNAAEDDGPMEATPPLFPARRPPHRGWYRVRFDLPGSRPPSGWAVRLGPVLTADEVFLNGVRIGGTGRIDLDFVDAQHPGRLYALPDEALRPAGNVLAVRVQSSLPWGGFTGPALLGPYTALMDLDCRIAGRRQWREAFVAGWAAMALLVWALLYRHEKRGREYRMLGALLALPLAVFLLESRLCLEAGWLTPSTQRVSVALFILMPAPLLLLQGSGGWPRRIRLALAAACALMAVGYAGCGDLGVCHVLFEAWGVVTLAGLGVLAVEQWRPGAVPRSSVAIAALAGVVWFALFGAAEFMFARMAAAPFSFSLLLHIGYAGYIGALAAAMARQYLHAQRRSRELAQQLVVAQETERRRIASNLHDDVAPDLATAKLDWQIFLHERGLDAEGGPLVDSVSRAIEALRSVSHELRPTAVDRLGLPAALRGLAGRLAGPNGWTLRLDLPAGSAFAAPPEVAISLYRMAQEALFNVARHARATVVELTLTVARGGDPAAHPRQRPRRDAGADRPRGRPGLDLAARARRGAGRRVPYSHPARHRRGGGPMAAELKLQVALADDHRLFLDGLRRLLERASDVDVIGVATTGAEAVALVRKRRPDLLLLDIDMPDMDGFAVADRLRDAGSPPKIILLTMHAEWPYLLAASRPDIQGFVLKDAAFDDLLDAIRRVGAGERYVSPAMAARPAEHSPLSPREQDILACAADGLTTQQTADRLGIGVKTVETHRTHILRKLGAANIAAAVGRWTIRNRTPPPGL